MTQQSLIARLSEYEKALADVLAANRASKAPPTTVREAEARLHVIRAAAARADVALTDLRDLIREAEGQDCVTKEDTPQFSCFKVSFADFQKMQSLPVGAKLYTALGEKS